MALCHFLKNTEIRKQNQNVCSCEHDEPADIWADQDQCGHKFGNNLSNDAVQAMRIGAAMTRTSDTTVFMSTMNLPMLVIVAWQMAAMQLFIMCFKPSIAAIKHAMPMAANQNVGLLPQTRT